jgi:hypothetical protein
MGIVKPCKAKDRLLKDPDTRRRLFDPVASDDVVPVGVISLPRITRHMNLAADCVALKKTVNKYLKYI